MRAFLKLKKETEIKGRLPFRRKKDKTRARYTFVSVWYRTNLIGIKEK